MNRRSRRTAAGRRPALVITAASLLTASPVAALPGTPRVVQSATLPSGTSDDGPNITAALATGAPVTLLRGSTYNILTPVMLPSNSELHLGGALINAAVPNTGTNAAFQTTIANGGPIALAAAPTAGASIFTVTSAAGILPGGWVEINDGTYFNTQILPVAAVTGSASPFTVYLDQGRTISWPYSPSTATAMASAPTTGVRLYGEGAVINATAPMPRGIELVGCVDCLVQDVTIQGPVGWGVSCDVGSYRCVQRDVHVSGPILTVTGAADNGSGKVRLTIGGAGVPSWLAGGGTVSVQGVGGTTEANGAQVVTVVDTTHLDLGAVAYAHAYTSGGWVTVMGVGAAFESCEACRGERLDISGVGSATGAQAGLFVYASRASVYDQVNVGGCWGAAGVAVDPGVGPFGSDGADLANLTTTGCGYGLVVYDSAARTRVSRSRFDGSMYDGVLLTSDGAGGAFYPSGTTLDELRITNGGARGVHLAGGTDTAIRDPRILGNGGDAIEIDAAARGTRVEGGRVDGNGGHLAYVAGDLTISGVVALNNGTGIESMGVATVVNATNVSQTWNTGNGTAYAWYANGGGYWTLVNCRGDFTGSTGIKIGVVTQASSVVRVTNFTALAGVMSYSLFVNGSGGVVNYGANDLVDTTTYGIRGTVTANNGQTMLH